MCFFRVWRDADWQTLISNWTPYASCINYWRVASLPCASPQTVRGGVPPTLKPPSSQFLTVEATVIELSPAGVPPCRIYSYTRCN